jgi:tripartite-type tricarboxylate transporter receptor subunit TctC
MPHTPFTRFTRRLVVAAKLAGQGIDVRTETPEAARAFIDTQIDTWAKVVKDNDIKAD